MKQLLNAILNFLKRFILIVKDEIPFLKKEGEFKHLLFVHPLIVMVMFDMMNYCNENGLSFKVTSIIRTPKEDKLLGTKHKVHQEGRAFDLRSWGEGWDAYTIGQFIDHYNKKYYDYGAVSSNDLKRRLVVYHNSGSGHHFHIQIDRKYAIENAWANL